MAQSAGASTSTQSGFFDENFSSISVPKRFLEELPRLELRDVRVSGRAGSPDGMELRGAPLYRSADPWTEAQQDLARYELPDSADIVALFGLGLGAHAEALEKRFGCRVVVYEPSLEVAAAALGSKKLDLTKTWVVPTIGDLVNVVEHTLLFTQRRAVTAAMPSYSERHPEELRRFEQAVQRARVNAAVQDSTTAAKQDAWIRYTLAALPKVAGLPTLESIGSHFRKRPGIVVGAGPSLSKNIALLERAKGRALIAAVNTSMHPLDRAGIVPDICAVTESEDQRRHFEGIDHLGEITLMSATYGHPGYWELPVKRIYPVVDGTQPVDEWLMDAMGIEKIRSGGSVSCTAFAVLYALGCDPIILLGQDLAFTSDKAYASGALSEDLAVQSNSGTVTLSRKEDRGGTNLITEPVTAYGGQDTIAAPPMFSKFRTWFEGAAQTWASDRTLVNATEGGARIHDFEEMPFEKALDRFCRKTFDVGAPFEETPSNRDAAAVAAELSRRVSRELERVLRTKNEASAAARLSAAAVKQLKKRRVDQAQQTIEKLSRHETAIASGESEKSSLLEGFISAKAHEIRMEQSGPPPEDPIKKTLVSLSRGKKLFDTIAAGAGELKNLLAEAKKQLDQIS